MGLPPWGLHPGGSAFCIRGPLSPGESASRRGLPLGEGSASGEEVGQTPDTWDTTGYGQQLGGTHPTIMFSCFQLFLFGWHVGG